MSPRPARVALALLTALVLVLTGARTHAEVGLDSLFPAEGTVGTVLELRLTGDVGPGKPKVWLTLADDPAPKPKRTKLKVTVVSDLGGGVTSVLMSFKKTKTGPGAYDLHVKPKGKGQVEQVFEDAFTMQTPQVDAVSPGTSFPKQPITLTGSFLGGGAKTKVTFTPVGGGKPRKGKVLPGGSDELLMVKLPKLAAGDHDVTVDHAVGAGVLEAGLVVVGAGGSNRVTATLSSVEQALLVQDYEAGDGGAPTSIAQAFFSPAPLGDVMTLTTGMPVGGETFTFSIAFPFVPGVTPTPFTIQTGESFSNFGITVSQSAPEVDWAQFMDVPGMLTVTAATLDRVVGTFEFTVPPATPIPAAGDLLIGGGTFDLSVQLFTGD